jgi:hypothetical protein
VTLRPTFLLERRQWLPLDLAATFAVFDDRVAHEVPLGGILPAWTSAERP